MSVMLVCASRDLVRYTHTRGHDIETDVNVSGTIQCLSRATDTHGIAGLSRATDTHGIAGVTRCFNMFNMFKASYINMINSLIL